MRSDGYVRNWVGLLFFCVMVLNPIAATAGEAVLVKEIKVQGNQRIEDDAILRVIQTKNGDAYNDALLSEDLSAIFAMGWFDDVRVEVEKGPEGNTVIFIVKEKPTIREIIVNGNTVYDDEEINENIDISSGSILNIYRIRRNIKIIESLYKEKNYHNVKITYNIDPLEHNQANLEFNIEEGEKVRIKQIAFDGNKAYDSDELQDLMETSEKGFWSWITSSGELNKDDLQQDIFKLNAFYQNNGYAEARVAEPEIEFKDEWIYIKIKINEGPRFKMGHVDLKGDFIYPEEELLKHINIKKEPYYKRDTIRQDVLALTDIYADKGYAHADIFPEIKPDPETLSVDITFHIKQNEPVYFEKIIIHGNTKTRDKVIRRELRVYEQELYSSKRLKRSVSDLYRLDFFEDIKVKPQKGTADDQMILDIEVVEKPTGTFSFGGGYSGVDGPYVMASVSERNFLGRGQFLETKIQTGGNSNIFSVSFTEPWLFDIPLSASVNAYKSERDYDDYDRDSTGGGVQFGYPVFDYTRGYVGYAYDVSKIDNISEAVSPYVLEGRSVESGISLSLVYDSRNRPFNPSEGSKHRIMLQCTGIGGNIGFTKMTAETGWYFPLFWGTVGFLHAETGYVTRNSGKELPDYDRFYLGGINSVRGFDWRDITPKIDTGEDYDDGTPITIDIGGTEFVQFNVEYLFPIIEKSGLVGLFFYDAGNVWADDNHAAKSDSNLRESAGFGIRWFSPMGPLRLERGYILDQKPGEGSGRWEFNIGGSF
ncbi:MAG: outer membrane protein assembly factor BamA [Dissulfuribacterales bacterium]